MSVADVQLSTPDASTPATRPRRYWSEALRRLIAQPVAVAALALLVALFTLGALAPEVAPQGWNSINLNAHWENHGPAFDAWNHVLGTDNIGRDVVVRTLWGLHYTETSALLGALLASLLGLAVGAAAGLYGGRLDSVLMRFADVFTIFPAIVVMIVVFTVARPLTLEKATLVFGLYLWAFMARAVRARIVSLRAETFIEAAYAIGASRPRIFFRHLLPNLSGTVLIAATSIVGQIILVEAMAEFFGFGLNSLNRPTLGNLLAEATSSGIGPYNQLGLGWWVWVGPAAVIVLILVCVNLVGDGLTEALDPLAKRR